MKKTYLFTALLAGLVAAGCSQNETIGDMVDGAQTPVSFGTYVGKTTNGRVAVENAFEENDVFNVFGYYTGQENYANTMSPNYMLNQAVTATGSGVLTWGYSPIKYWPNTVSDKVSFFAYSTGENTTNTKVTNVMVAATPGDPIITYTTDADDTGADLLYAKVINQTKTTTPINFDFKHAMSRIGFTVTADKDYTTPTTDETTITLTSIKFGSGTELNKSNTFNLATQLWGTASADKYSIILNADQFVTNDVNATASSVVTITGIKNSDDAYLMIIPQDLSSAKMQISYTVTHKDGVVVPNTEEVSLQDFVMGSAYRYNIVISLTGVTVSGSIEATPGWGSETTIAIP